MDRWEWYSGFYGWELSSSGNPLEKTSSLLSTYLHSHCFVDMILISLLILSDDFRWLCSSQWETESSNSPCCPLMLALVPAHCWMLTRLWDLDKRGRGGLWSVVLTRWFTFWWKSLAPTSLVNPAHHISDLGFLSVQTWSSKPVDSHLCILSQAVCYVPLMYQMLCLIELKVEVV